MNPPRDRSPGFDPLRDQSPGFDPRGIDPRDLIPWGINPGDLNDQIFIVRNALCSAKLWAEAEKSAREVKKKAFSEKAPFRYGPAQSGKYQYQSSSRG